MKLSSSFALLHDLILAIRASLPPTLFAVLHSPSLILNPTAISRLVMANTWLKFAQFVDENGKAVKLNLISPNAYGVVLDIGAGHGHTLNYLDHTRVTKYIALEPNTLMHPHIRSLAYSLGYSESSGTLQITSTGAEAISSSVPNDSIDTLISILTLCSVPDLSKTLNGLVKTLKPGGTFLFYEHVLSPREDVRWWQRFWSPIWSRAFDGCRLDQPTDKVVTELTLGGGGGLWKDVQVWGKDGEDRENLFWHQAGMFVRR